MENKNHAIRKKTRSSGDDGGWWMAMIVQDLVVIGDLNNRRWNRAEQVTIVGDLGNRIERRRRHEQVASKAKTRRRHDDKCDDQRSDRISGTRKQGIFNNGNIATPG